MSNALAIASVTRILKDLLNDAFVNRDVSPGVTITAVPPDRALAGVTGDSVSLNLYLHRITPNAALSNSDLPTRDARGGLVRNPRLAIDLHYLLSAYTNAELKGEILLGYAMELLHETPVLARNLIRAALKKGLNGSLLPTDFKDADPASLADQIELIRITPQILSMDDMSKLWAAFQTNYRTTVAYLVSVVLIERDLEPRNPLPVLSRGRRDPASGRDAGVAVHPDLAPATPVLTGLAPSGHRPALRLGEILVLHGHHLDEGSARIRFTAPETGKTLELAPEPSATPGRLEAELPDTALPAGSPLAGTGEDPDAWRVGTYLVDVVLQAAAQPERTTNRLPVLLAPKATPTAAKAGSGTKITITCQPVIRAQQTVAIIAGQVERAVAVPKDTATVAASFPGLAKDALVPVRLRVAGVDSLLVDPATNPPSFDPTQIVTVP
ncbi:MAG: hypothetical protein QOH47_1764 [Sphingomonadales bacterium]|jgi:hypothetical protein|nr:hypothetical protein [Sphingomonadales bacterium]